MKPSQHKTSRKLRSQRGLAITTIMSFIAAFIIGPVSVLVYEMVKYNIAQQELKHCVDAAALAAACAVTGSSNGSITVTDQMAMQQAICMFQQNSILGVNLTGATYTYDPQPGGTAAPSTIAANASALYFQFLNPVGMVQVGMGGTNGKIVRITGLFGFVPDFAAFIGLPKTSFPVVAQSDGGLPQLDVVLCFDLSASMDDFTNVCLVNRYASSKSTTNTSSSYSTLAYNGYTIIAQNNLYTAISATNSTGTAVNAAWPMQLDEGGGVDGTVQWNSSGHGVHTAHLPPYAQGSSSLTSSTYTDMVVPLDGSTNCANAVTITGNYGTSSYTYSFPAGSQGVAVLVEAARGNLESATAASAAGLQVVGGKALGVTLQPGWFAAYYTAVMGVVTPQNTTLPGNSVFTMTSMTPNNMPLRHPIGDGIAAAESFFQVLNNDADVHFGIVCFSTSIGTTYNSTQSNEYAMYTNNSLTSPYPGEPIAAPLPYVALQSTAGPAYSNYSSTTPAASTSVNGSLYTSSGTVSGQTLPPGTCVAEGGTNISAALNGALAMFLPTTKSTPDGTQGKALSRKGSTQAIVLFTDGLPTMGGDSGTSDPSSQAVATAAQSAGIPIYTIGLSLVSSLTSEQTAVLTDSPGTTGIAALSGNGATFTQTSSSNTLTAVFQNVARQLVQLVQ
ncbi:MAG TPA: VWA domain-containing protein [Oculatellaceae cyanobacterium]